MQIIYVKSHSKDGFHKLSFKEKKQLQQQQLHASEGNRIGPVGPILTESLSQICAIWLVSQSAFTFHHHDCINYSKKCFHVKTIDSLSIFTHEINALYLSTCMDWGQMGHICSIRSIDAGWLANVQLCMHFKGNIHAHIIWYIILSYTLRNIKGGLVKLRWSH